MSKQWFIISVFTGQEKQVKAKLDKLRELNSENFGEVKLPTKGKKEEVCFPGYVFAEMNLFQNFAEKIKNQDVWNTLYGIDKVIGPLGGENVYPMSEDELLSLDKMSKKDETEQNKVVFNVGDSVKILEGAFAGNIGIISTIANDVATVKIEIFGEEIEQEISLGSLEKNV